MTMDLGLLGGIAAGLNEGRAAYNDEKRYQEKKQQDAMEQALKKRMFAAQLAGQGLSEDHGSGAIGKSPETIKNEAFERATKQAGLLKSGYQLGDYDEANHSYGLVKDPHFRDYDEENKRLTNQKLKNDLKNSEAKTTPQGKLEKSGADVKQKVGFIVSALKNLTDYEGVFRKGSRQGYLTKDTPLVGGIISNTPIDASRTNMEEAIGRLASGGAINKDEEVRFRGMLPRAGDDDEAAVRSLLGLRKEMEAKLTAYGFSTDELQGLGFKPDELGYGTEYSGLDGRGLLKKRTQKRQTPGTAPIEQSVANDQFDPKEFTPDVVNYANKHGITLQDALKIKKQRGG